MWICDEAREQIPATLGLLRAVTDAGSPTPVMSAKLESDKLCEYLGDPYLEIVLDTERHLEVNMEYKLGEVFRRDCEADGVGGGFWCSTIPFPVGGDKADISIDLGVYARCV